MSLPSNWSQQGQAARDLSTRHVRAPQSALEVHGKKARQPLLGIGHPLSLRCHQHADLPGAGSEQEDGLWILPELWKTPKAFPTAPWTVRAALRPQAPQARRRGEIEKERSRNIARDLGVLLTLSSGFWKIADGCSAPPPSPPPNWTSSPDRRAALLNGSA